MIDEIGVRWEYFVIVAGEIGIIYLVKLGIIDFNGKKLGIVDFNEKKLY